MTQDDYIKAYTLGESFKDVLISFAERSPYPSYGGNINGDRCFYCDVEEYIGLHTAECIWQRLQYLIEKE